MLRISLLLLKSHRHTLCKIFYPPAVSRGTFERWSLFNQLFVLSVLAKSVREQFVTPTYSKSIGISAYANCWFFFFFFLFRRSIASVCIFATIPSPRHCSDIRKLHRMTSAGPFLAAAVLRLDTGIHIGVYDIHEKVDTAEHYR